MECYDGSTPPQAVFLKIVDLQLPPCRAIMKYQFLFIAIISSIVIAFNVTGTAQLFSVLFHAASEVIHKMEGAQVIPKEESKIHRQHVSDTEYEVQSTRHN